MNSPAGPCEWCGGPQSWTIVRGEMYTECQGGCLGLFDEGPDNPPTACDVALWVGEGRDEMEPPDGGRVVPLEGGDTEESNGSVLQHIGVPLKAVLYNLWIGGPCDG